MSERITDTVFLLMAIGQVAPQAYTRDTLAQAYAWVQSQPDNIKKMATSPDFLVGLYLRYQRHGEQTSISSPSAQTTFKSDLKNLAGEFKSPEEMAPPKPRVVPPAAAIAAAQWNSPSPRVSQWAHPPQQQESSRSARPAPVASPSVGMSSLGGSVSAAARAMEEDLSQSVEIPQYTPSHVSYETHYESQQRHVPVEPPRYEPPAPRYAPPPPPQRAPEPPPREKQLEDFLDPRTMKMVEDIKSLLNLGSEAEACRALISMGYDRMRILFNHR